MKKLGQILLLGTLMVFLGCATDGQGTSSGYVAAPDKAPPSANKKLTAEDYKRMGITGNH